MTDTSLICTEPEVSLPRIAPLAVRARPFRDDSAVYQRDAERRVTEWSAALADIYTRVALSPVASFHLIGYVGVFGVDLYQRMVGNDHSVAQHFKSSRHPFTVLWMGTCVSEYDYANSAVARTGFAVSPTDDQLRVQMAILAAQGDVCFPVIRHDQSVFIDKLVTSTRVLCEASELAKHNGRILAFSDDVFVCLAAIQVFFSAAHLRSRGAGPDVRGAAAATVFFAQRTFLKIACSPYVQFSLHGMLYCAAVVCSIIYESYTLECGNQPPPAHEFVRWRAIVVGPDGDVLDVLRCNVPRSCMIKELYIQTYTSFARSSVGPVSAAEKRTFVNPHTRRTYEDASRWLPHLSLVQCVNFFSAVFHVYADRPFKTPQLSSEPVCKNVRDAVLALLDHNFGEIEDALLANADSAGVQHLIASDCQVLLPSEMPRVGGNPLEFAHVLRALLVGRDAESLQRAASTRVRFLGAARSIAATTDSVFIHQFPSPSSGGACSGSSSGGSDSGEPAKSSLGEASSVQFGEASSRGSDSGEPA